MVAVFAESMNDTETQILAALKELDLTVRNLAAANPKPNLLPLFTRIDDLARKLPAQTDPELMHFLQRKSYEKALARLQGQAAARGSCGR